MDTEKELELLRLELNRQLERSSALAEELGIHREFLRQMADLAREYGLRNPHYDPGLVSRPVISTNASAVRLGAPGSSYDVVCFSIIDWEFRWQRPQQVMSQFAREGHRVFFISISRYLPVTGERCAVRQLRDNVWEVQLSVPERIDVYGSELTRELVQVLMDDLRALRNTFNIVSAISFVQLATWASLGYAARSEFGWRLVYDCMDEWDTFPGMSQALLAAERRLLRDADLLVVTGRTLYQKYAPLNANTVLARNAADFERFHAPAAEPVLEDVPHPIVGYFGAIADWFDVELVARAARERPHYSFVLIGGVFDVDTRVFDGFPNVHLLGQQPYALMPSFLARFDVCCIPFRINPITEATDPVKFYEYISQGKPVVATAMHELEAWSDLLYIGRDHAGFIAGLDAAVRENDSALVERRIALARENTWADRVAAIKEGVRAAHPLASIVVVTYGNLEYTRGCLESVMARTLYPNFEVIVVDNGSTDGTPEYLRQFEREHANVKVILNEGNRGFAAANNQGLAVAGGQFLVLLNNDTVVPAGWLARLIRQLGREETGLVNAVTNFSGNESKIDVDYTDMTSMERFAHARGRDFDGEFFDIRVAAMYCVAMRRDVFERVGPLDEKFGIGMFEDDDYSHRVRVAGYRVVCAEDTFVHHYGQASFKKLTAEAYQKAWDANQAWFEEKWGTKWKPHTPRRWSPERPTMPDRLAIELLFAKLGKVAELEESEKNRYLEAKSLREEIAARDEHLEIIKRDLFLLQQQFDAIVSSRGWQALQIGWKVLKTVRPKRRPKPPPPPPPLGADAFAPGPGPAEPPPALPPKPSSSGERAASAPLLRPDAYDVLCLPIVEWDFRFQRPQQMAAELARKGHRVFYVSHRMRGEGPPYAVRTAAEGIYEVTLLGPTRDVFVQTLTATDVRELLGVLELLRDEQKFGATVALTQLPFWGPLALAARERFGWPVVYDCMDLHAGFATAPRNVIEQERDLVRRADLVCASSLELEAQVRDHTANLLMLRNAADWDHFAAAAGKEAPWRKGTRPLIGYYGAIAEWFDAELVAALARRNPQWDFVLIGSTVSADMRPLRKVRNVSLAGERPYAEIPQWLAKFDVAIIPFRLTPLTAATNPVKAYEMFAGGKPVVSTPLPEMMAMAPLARIASTVEEFEKEIREALEFDDDPVIVERRRRFARENTWAARIAALDSRIRDLFPSVTVVVRDGPERLDTDHPNVRVVKWAEGMELPAGDVVVFAAEAKTLRGRGVITRIASALHAGGEDIVEHDRSASFPWNVAVAGAALERRPRPEKVEAVLRAAGLVRAGVAE